MSAPAGFEFEADSGPVTAILAGGLATRLGELSTTLPKSLLPVGGDPFIAHQLRLLAGQGFCQVAICAGHLGGLIQDFVGDGSAFGCSVTYSFDGGGDGEQLLGTGGALRKALPLLGARFLAMYGDSYLRAPILPIWRSFLDSGKAALMTVLHNEDRWDRSNIEYSVECSKGEFPPGEILRYDKTSPSPAMRHIDYGLGCIRSEALSAFAQEDDRFDLASFYQAMCERHELAGFEVKERFYEIGSPAGLAETRALFAQSGDDPE